MSRFRDKDSGEDFQARLEAARHAKTSAIAAREDERGGIDDPESVIYFARKQRQTISAQDRLQKQKREDNSRNQDERARLGYSAWKEKEAERFRQKALEQREDAARDVRSDRQRREESRELRRVDRVAWRENETEDMERRSHERTLEDSQRRSKREEERDDWGRYWARREAQRDDLRLRRERFQTERHAREDERALNANLREARQQLAEEAETVAASEWSSLLTLRTKERQRRLLRLARLHASMPIPPDEDALPGDAKATAEGVREAQRLRRREAALHARVAEEEGDSASMKAWYQQRAFDRVDRTRRTIKSIDAPPPAVIPDA